MSLYSIYIYLSIIGLISTTNGQQFNSSLDLDIESETQSQRLNSSRMLPFFQRPSILNIVRFPNEECFDASNQSGTCYTAFECKKLGGAPSSSCARGLGTCCIVSRSCHNTTANKVVYFKNPSYPQSDSQQNFCDLTVNLYDPDVCQLKIDFISFVLDQPTSGNCMGDKFRISASGFAPTSVPVLCGNNDNQHIYVSLPRDMTQRSASIVFETDSMGDYRWHLRITQIDCNLRNKKNLLTDRNGRFVSFGPSGPTIPLLTNPRIAYSLPAPMGCLQYFTQPTGNVQSFNFGEYLNNLDYAICIERQPNTCRVTFKASDWLWSIDSTLNDKTKSGVGDNDCPNDYLMIPAASQTGDGFTYDRYCGGVLNYNRLQSSDAPVVSKANGPIVLRFHSDAIQDPTVKDGFRLQFEQSSTDCMPQFSLNSNPYNPTPVVTNLVAQYIDSQALKIPNFEKHEPIVYLSKPEPHLRTNAKHLKF